MQFCKDYADQEETDWCFFSEGPNNAQKCSRISRDSPCLNIRCRNCERTSQALHKQTRPISKTHRKQKSQQKGKLSLSKLSGRRANQARQSQDTKIKTTPVYYSAPKSQVLQNSENNRPMSVVFPGSQAQNHKLHTHFRVQNQPFYSQRATNYGAGFKVYNNVPEFSVIQSAQMKYNSQGQTMPVNPLNFTISGELQLDSKMQQHTRARYISHQPPTSLNQEQPVSTRPKIPIPEIYEPRMKNSLRLPARNTSILEKSQHFLYDHPAKTSLATHVPAHSKDSQPQQLEELQSSRHSLMPGLAGKDLKTVQSIYGSEKCAQQIDESVIMVDFFHPQQSLRRELEQRIQARYGFHLQP